MSRIDTGELRLWIGRTETRDDVVTVAPPEALSATLDRKDPLVELPPLYHWLYFLPVVQQAQVGPDGHPARGGFLPPVPLPRRMWAASRLEFHRPLQLGDKITRTSEIVDVQLKGSRS